VLTFWPTVGTVGLEGGGAEEQRVLMLDRRVVLPALSRPRRRMEYSALVNGVRTGGQLLETVVWGGRNGWVPSLEVAHR